MKFKWFFDALAWARSGWVLESEHDSAFGSTRYWRKDLSWAEIKQNRLGFVFLIMPFILILSLVLGFVFYSKDLKIKSAEAGDVNAQVELALEYYQKKDFNKSVAWAEKAAEGGNAFAQYMLSYAYRCGQGVVQDFDKAFYWCEKSANQGESCAQLDLGVMCTDGLGSVHPDYNKALYWLSLAEKSRQNDDACAYNLGQIYLKLEQFEKAAGYYKKTLSINSRHDDAALNLACLYFNGTGVPQDYVESRRFLLIAAENGSGLAMANLGLVYSNGFGVPVDLNKAQGWLEKAVAVGCEDAQGLLSKVIAAQK
ncbi:sel1 repeat family protein [Candidatus Dependentiae bacterium]|nr:sel1 repeat family protein [Candidatus Dependentiae bacterium]